MNLKTRIEKLETDIPDRDLAVAMLARLECEREGVPFSRDNIPVGFTFVDLLRQVREASKLRSDTEGVSR